MKHQLTFIVVIFIVATILACSSEKQVEDQTEAIEIFAPPLADNSRNSLDWNGVYKGTTPCADCEGIETTITLKSDGTFKRSMKYLGKDDNPFYDEGSFEWNEEGSKVTLIDSKGEKQQYQVGENVLFHLDKDGNRISGDLAPNYRLAKNPTDPRLEGKKWILVELRGKAIEGNEGLKEAFIMFEMETSSFSGNSSCNNVFGPYELKEGDRLSFGNAASTMMACPDMQTERTFLDILKEVDNYSIAEGKLSLNKAKMAPLARFREAEG
ncbi:copper resistance protein NlpE N-terminal domain-containing protein [Shivajiella indica]|uniref:Copper resistance protein NlpE N-terminal domain-containing protein n=1 Tax=Shivajiella indica TaxID=872115 RepID=A0ABW5BER2_9BACT